MFHMLNVLILRLLLVSDILLVSLAHFLRALDIVLTPKLRCKSFGSDVDEMGKSSNHKTVDCSVMWSSCWTPKH